MSSTFMLLFRNAGHETHAHLTPAERTVLAQKWNDWYDGLARAGKAVHGQPLALEGRVITGAGANARVTDGPFAEATEVVGGYVMLAVDSFEEATEIGKRCPGLALGLSVEVRPIAPVSPVLAEVAARPPKA